LHDISPDIMTRLLPLLAALALQACVAAAPPAGAPPPVSASASPAQRFAAVAARVEPVAEQLCRSLRRGGQGGPSRCDITIAVDTRPDLPPNALQTVDPQGRPYVIFTAALIEDARNADELAFVLGHEAAHHIAGHIPRRQQQATAGALLAGALAHASGLTPDEVRQAQSIGAEIAARQYSQEFELEADALGAEIALRAGFDPVRGAAFFDRLPDPGAGFLNSHPPNAARKRLVAETVTRLQGS
jgi:Zn-dependent protease with chaperone function